MKIKQAQKIALDPILAVHEYIEDLAVLSSALRSGHAFVPALVDGASRCVAEVERLLGGNANNNQ